MVGSKNSPPEDRAMPKYNTQFNLDINDVELIETALRNAAVSASAEIDARDANDLLGRLHNQKVFYRPRDGVYISG